jgi:hypothetical protein
MEKLEIGTKKTMKKLGLRFSVMMMVGLGTVTVARSQQTPPPSDSYTQTVKREVLASGYPSEAEGRILELDTLYHSCWDKTTTSYSSRDANCKSGIGTLTYNVVKGTTKIKRANGKEETLDAGQTTRLTVGDSFVEPGGMVHYGQNETEDVVIMISASLLDSQKPKTIFIEP